MIVNGLSGSTLAPGSFMNNFRDGPFHCNEYFDHDGFRELARTFARAHGLDSVEDATRTLIDGPLACPAARDDCARRSRCGADLDVGPL